MPWSRGGVLSESGAALEELPQYQWNGDSDAEGDADEATTLL